jgi:DNA-binding transcriptional LysR family regulator
MGQLMSDRLTALKVFARAARSGSFSRAGRELGLSQPSVSRIVSDLERELGAKLLIRSTRALALTVTGADYLAKIEPILAALTEADRATHYAGAENGVLRIALSSSFAVRDVIPRLPTFMRQHPQLRIDLRVDDSRQDLVANGIDLALRFGELADSGAVARKLACVPRRLVGSPAYVLRAGAPKTPDDLHHHAVIVGPAGAGHASRTFTKDRRTVSIRTEGHVTSTSNETAIAAAVAGLGLTVTSLWACRAELERGALVRLLPDWSIAQVELHAVFPAGRSAPPAARLFADFLGSQIGMPDLEARGTSLLGII